MSNYPPAPEHCASLYRWKNSSATGWIAGQLNKFNFWRLEGQGLYVQLPDSMGLNRNDQGRFLAVFVDSGAEKWISENEAVLSSVRDWFFLTPTPKKGPPLVADFSRRKRWMQFLEDIREIFKEMNLEEVQTPTLVPSPGGEVHLDPFITEFSYGRSQRKLFLPTSPEMHLKKLLAAGWTDIFEFAKSFRNKEVSALHEPEFWMLEWYRAFSNLEQIERDCCHIFEKLVQMNWLEESGKPIRRTMSELFNEFLNFKLAPTTSLEELKEVARKEGLSSKGDWDDLFCLLFLERIEPEIAKFSGPVFVYEYPVSQAAMSRLDENGWCQRFELYYRGYELANAFHELNDPVEQAKRWEEDQQRRKQLGREPFPMDLEFQASLESGLPPAGGIALGLERLFLICENLSDFSNLRDFSAQRWL